MAIQPDEKILLVISTRLPDRLAPALMRLNTDGSLDAGFIPFELQQGGNQVAVSEDGKIILTGWVGGKSSLVRLNPNGTPDISFKPQISAPAVYSFALQQDGKLLNGGANYLKLTSIMRSPVGPGPLRLIGRPGRTYMLEGSMDLRNWLPVGTQTATSYTIEFEDADAAKFPQRFYRGLGP